MTTTEPYIPMLDGLVEINPEIARHVLAHYGCEGGHQAEPFTSALIETIARADVFNRALLATSYPGYVKAVILADRTDSGVHQLREIADGGAS